MEPKGAMCLSLDLCLRLPDLKVTVINYIADVLLFCYRVLNCAHIPIDIRPSRVGLTLEWDSDNEGQKTYMRHQLSRNISMHRPLRASCSYAICTTVL